MVNQLFDSAHARYLETQTHGVLATIAPSGSPQAKPVGFHYDPLRGTIDISGYEMEHSAKFGNVAANPQVAFTLNDVPDPDAGAEGVRFMEIRGTAEHVKLGKPQIDGVSPWIIRIHPRRVVSYNVAGSGMHATDLRGDPGVGDDAPRPTVGLTGTAADRARRAVESQVDELQFGLGDGDAETYNRRFADDVMWGSPYGATVAGYDTLHAIHGRMHRSGDRGRSRYEIVRVLAPTSGVALAQVRRIALDEQGDPIPSRDGEPRFSEMALYVLVRRGRRWWLAAGQNTVINIDRGAVR
jgi:PPOX class F420-dependent enzyme/OxyR family protein